MKKTIYDRYLEIVSNIEGIRESDLIPFAEELAHRHSRGWRLPDSVYQRNKDILYYKSSLERHSPYYVDLFKIEERNDLKTVLKDLYLTIKKFKYSRRESSLSYEL